MEKKLKAMFDYQKFARNPRLDAMLSEAEARYECSLSDDDLELVSAAGDGIMPVYCPEETINAYGEQGLAVPVINLPPEDRL